MSASASSPALTLASTLQSASLNRHPSPTHDLNPSTSASQKLPVIPPQPRRSHSAASSSHSTIPLEALKPVPRSTTTALPPLPDLRFEQSYLASLRGCRGGVWGVLGVTVRDQVLLPLIQGMLWTLALSGWRYWNKSAEFSGASVGSRVRRWWYGVNNWEIPGVKGGKGMMAEEVDEFYTGQFGSAGRD